MFVPVWPSHFGPIPHPFPAPLPLEYPSQNIVVGAHKLAVVVVGKVVVEFRFAVVQANPGGQAILKIGKICKYFCVFSIFHIKSLNASIHPFFHKKKFKRTNSFKSNHFTVNFLRMAHFFFVMAKQWMGRIGFQNCPLQQLFPPFYYSPLCSTSLILFSSMMGAAAIFCWWAIVAGFAQLDVGETTTNKNMANGNKAAGNCC
jgi:hypothetical protein